MVVASFLQSRRAQLANESLSPPPEDFILRIVSLTNRNGIDMSTIFLLFPSILSHGIKVHEFCLVIT